MIRNDAELRETKARLLEIETSSSELRTLLAQKDIPPREIDNVLASRHLIQSQLEADIAHYESLLAGSTPTEAMLCDVGRRIIELRVSRKMTQRQLAEKLGIHESQVSRDERNEYQGASLNRIERVLEALGVRGRCHFTLEDHPA